MLSKLIHNASDFISRNKKVFSLLLLPITGVSILLGLVLIAPIFFMGRTLGLKMSYSNPEMGPGAEKRKAGEVDHQASKFLEAVQVGSTGRANEAHPAPVLGEVAALQHLEKRLPTDAGGGFLKISIYPDRIERMIRHATDRNDIRFRPTTVVNQRQKLLAVTKDLAAAKGVTYDVTGALELTLSELRGGHLHTAATKPQGVKTAPANKVDEHAAKPPVSKAVSSARGRVKSAALVRVTPEGKRPYQTFQVVISPVDGSEDVSFSGNDLGEKFEKKLFAKGDVISIRKSRVAYSETSGDGKTHEKSKNVFEIEQLQFA